MSDLRDKWRCGQTTYMAASMLSASVITEMLAGAGFDVIMIDQQHGFFTRESFVAALQGARAGGATALVRVPGLDRAQIGAALDAGAHGVVVPAVETAAEAAAAVAACKYPPAGVRSFGPTRSSLVVPGPPAEVNAQTLCIPLVETQAGAQAVADICDCPGVDAIMIGPVDLALSAGLSPSGTDPQLETLIDQILATCKVKGIPTIIGGTPGETARRRAAQGHSTILLGSDIGYIASSAGRALADSGGRI